MDWQLVPPESVYRLFATNTTRYSDARLDSLDTIIKELANAGAASSYLTRLKRTRNNASFLCGFPPEIICDIISFAKVDFGWPKLNAVARCDWYDDDEDNEEEETSRAQNSVDLGWIELTHMCSYWRELAINTPSLWTDPRDYFALPPLFSRLIRERARNLPSRLELSASSLRRLKSVGHKILLPARNVPVAELLLLSFSVGNFRFLERGYFRVGSFRSLRQLTVSVLLGADECPVLLPTVLTSNSYMTRVELHNCLPSRWDAPMFGPYLIRLSLSYTGDPEVPHLMPSTLEFSRILASATALEFFTIDGIHLQGPTYPYPPMILSSELRGMDVVNWRNASQHRDALVFLTNVVFRRPNIRMEVSLGVLDGGLIDMASSGADAKRIQSLIRSALENIYRQQFSPPRHIILGHKSFLTHDSETQQSPQRARPISMTQYMYADVPGVSSLLTFDFDLPSIADTSFLYEGAVPIPLHELRSISLNCSGAWAHLESDLWWHAMRDAEHVRDIALYFSDCAKLLPLLKTVSTDGTLAFAAFPALKILHIHLERSFITNRLRERDAVSTGAAAALQAIVRARKDHSVDSRLEALFVDNALRGWAIWSTLAIDIPVIFQGSSSYLQALWGS
ncbi:unnamed protein product [Peniophora sp. CBMAI 1063]|nr:unnamed protein product [Peniophora sp. CBMAI 1063]